LRVRNSVEVEPLRNVNEGRSWFPSTRAGFQPKEFSVKGSVRGQDKELKIQADDMVGARRQAESQGMRVKNVTPSENAVLSSGQFQPPADPNKEHVVDAAVRMPTGEVFSGSFHGDAMKKALDAGHLELDTAKDGFVTSTGRFVDRNAAFKLANEAGQVTPESLQKRGVPAGFNKLESTTFQEARQFQPKSIADQMDDPKTWEEIKNFKGGKYGNGLTGWAFEQGIHATPDDLAGFKAARESYKDLAKDAMASKDYMKAQEYGLKGQLAHEAYQIATGERLDGIKGTTQDFIRKHYDPNFTPPLAVDKAETFTNSGFNTALEDIKSGKSAGHTFNPDGTEWAAPKDPTDIVTLVHKDIPLSELTEGSVHKYLDLYKQVFETPGTVAGLYKFNRDGKDMVSIDINTAVPQTHRENTLRFARINNQMAIWDAAKNEEVPAGGTGTARLSDDPRKAESIANAAERISQGKPYFSERLLEKEIRGMGLEPRLEDMRFRSQFQPKQKEDWELMPGGPEGVSKAWISPTGEPIQLGGMWHHHGLAEDPQAMAAAKAAGLKVPPFEGTDSDQVRENAVNKGFVRVDYRKNSGRLTIEASADHWAKQKDAVRKLIEANLDDVDNLSLTLVDRKMKSVDSNHAKLFELDTDAEKLDAIPLLSESAPSARKETPIAESETLRPDKSYNPSDNYFKGQAQPIPADVQKELDAGKSLTWDTLKDVPPATLHAAGYKSLRLEWNESHHDPEFYPVPLKDASGPYQMTDAGVKAAYESGLEKANTAWELSRKNQFQPSGELPLTGEPAKQEALDLVTPRKIKE
jgi:hypothetical protein